MWYFTIDRVRAKSSASTSALLSVERNWRELGSLFDARPNFRRNREGVKAGEDYMHIIRVVGGRTEEKRGRKREMGKE